MKTAVYEFLATIPKGKVVTYGDIAEYVGNKRAARAIGNILHHNPDGELYPCYKVVASTGKLSVNYAFGGIEAQAKKLLADGIEVVDNVVDLQKYRYYPQK